MDFDFFTNRNFQPEDLVAKFDFLAGAEILQTQPDTLTVLTLDSKDATHRVKISFFGGLGFGRLWDPRTTPDGIAQIASLQDLLAHKLKVLLYRVEIKGYLDIDELLSHGMDLAESCAGAQALFPAFAVQGCLKALTYFHEPSLKTLSTTVQQRLVKAVEAVSEIPQAAVKSKVLCG